MREQITAALRQSMKARDPARTSALRMIQAAVTERDIEARGKGASQAGDDELQTVLARMVRQRDESARLYSEGGRPELAAAELAEAGIIREFMPKQMTDAEIRAAAKEAVAATRAVSPRDMGRVMAALKERHAGHLNLGAASALVREMLGAGQSATEAAAPHDQTVTQQGDLEQ